jgi:hypothetical protein
MAPTVTNLCHSFRMHVRTAWGAPVAAIVLWMSNAHAQAPATPDRSSGGPSRQVQKEILSRVAEIEACWQEMNDLYAFELQDKLWLTTNTRQPPTPAQLQDRSRPTRRERKAIEEWLEHTRSCSDGMASEQLGDRALAANAESRFATVGLLLRGESYGQANTVLYRVAQLLERYFPVTHKVLPDRRGSSSRAAEN